jgi:hypothetical protein
MYLRCRTARPSPCEEILTGRSALWYQRLIDAEDSHRGTNRKSGAVRLTLSKHGRGKRAQRPRREADS